MYFDHLTRVIKMAFVCIFFLFNCSLSHFDLRCALHSYKIIWIYLSIYTSTCRSIYRNCLRFECSVVISKCWQRKTKHETWNLCMWLIPFQSRFCSFSSFVLNCFFFQFTRHVFFYSNMIVVIVVVVWLLNKWQAIQCYYCLQLHCIFQIFSFFLCVFFISGSCIRAQHDLFIKRDWKMCEHFKFHLIETGWECEKVLNQIRNSILTYGHWLPLYWFISNRFDRSILHLHYFIIHFD